MADIPGWRMSQVAGQRPLRLDRLGPPAAEHGIHDVPAVQPETQPGSLLFAAGEVHGDEIYRALSQKLGVVYVRLGEFDVEPAALACLPSEFARTRRAAVDVPRRAPGHRH